MEQQGRINLLLFTVIFCPLTVDSAYISRSVEDVDDFFVINFSLKSSLFSAFLKPYYN